jgi:hypothetical protein
MPKTRLKVRFTLDADYSGMLYMLHRYDGQRGTPSQYVARYMKAMLADFTCDLWREGHIWVPRRVLQRAAGDSALGRAGRTPEENTARYMAMFDEAYGPGQDSPYWIPSQIQQMIRANSEAA